MLGLDHLCFLLAIGAAAAFLVGGARVIAAFMVASFAGVVLHLGHVGLPFVEAGIAATVMAAGVLLLTGPARVGGAVLVLALVGGVLHGYALAESIVGVEASPLSSERADRRLMARTPNHRAINPAVSAPTTPRFAM